MCYNMISEHSLQELTKEVWNHGGTTYTFRKLNAIDGWRIMDRIRKAISEATPSEIDSNDPLTIFVKTIMGLDSDFVDALRIEMFKYVNYSRDNKSDTPVPLAGHEAEAFMDSSFDAIYNVLVRSLVLNFFEGCSQILSLLFQEVEEEK